MRFTTNQILPVVALFGLIGCAPDTPVAVEQIDVEEIEPFTVETLQEFFKVNLDQAQSLLKNNKNVLIIDLRSDEEFAQSHIPNANCYDVYFMNDAEPGILNFGFQQNMGVIDRGLKIMIYDNGGEDISRSIEATRTLKAIGFREVYWLQGGLSAWKEAELPTVTDLAVASPES